MARVLTDQDVQRDLLDLMQTAKFEGMDAADHLADVATAMVFHVSASNRPTQLAFSALLKQAVTDYRISRGQDTGEPDESHVWTGEEIMRQEG